MLPASVREVNVTRQPASFSKQASATMATFARVLAGAYVTISWLARCTRGQLINLRVSSPASCPGGSWPARLRLASQFVCVSSSGALEDG